MSTDLLDRLLTGPPALPGDIPGLLGRGAPAAWASPLWHPILVTRVGSHGPTMEPCCWVLDGEREQRARLDEVALDLTDEAGVDRAVRWLAVRVGEPISVTALGWLRYGRGWVMVPMSSDYGGMWFLPSGIYGDDGHMRVVPALARIDLADPLADVRALAIAVAFVAGRLG